jgi:hypothetical protein
MFSVAVQGMCVQTALSVEGRWGMIFASLEAEDLEGEGFSLISPFEISWNLKEIFPLTVNVNLIYIYIHIISFIYSLNVSNILKVCAQTVVRFLSGVQQPKR